MSLSNLIRSGDYATAQEAFDAITTPSIEVRDDQLYTWSGVALVVGPQAAEGLRIALIDNGLGWVVHQLGGLGIQLSNPLVQQALLGFAQAGLPGCADLAAKGISLQAPWQSAGLTEPTLADVEAAFAEVEAEKQKEALRLRLDAAWNRIGTSEQPQAIAELRAIANELEG